MEMNQKKKTKQRILFAIFITAGAFLLWFALLVTRSLFLFHDTLDEITASKTPTASFAVYVLKEDPASTLLDTAGYSYGTTNALRDSSFSSLWDQLQNELGTLPAVSSYETMFDLADGLKEKKVQAILLEETYLENFKEVPEYQWMKDEIKCIFRLVIQQDQPKEDSPSSSHTDADEAFLVYISGIDTYGDISTRSRSDVNILMAVNLNTHKITLVATPRDFYLSFFQTNGQKDKLAHAGIYGVEASIDALEQLYDVEVSYYLRLNFSGFVEIIDALGGIDVYSEYAFSVPGIKDYQKGYNRLTGLEALAFARERYSFSNGDYQRVNNQMEVIKGVIRACASPAILTNYKDIMDAAGDSIQTNMPKKQITNLIQMQLTEKPDWSVSTYTAQGSSAYRSTYSMPGQNLYVILPDAQSVANGASKLKETLNEP